MTRAAPLACVVGVAAGCHVVFPLPEVTSDAAPGPGDAPPPGCAVTDSDAPDEDGDGLPDACDSCPYDADNGGDLDGDGVGDACDPRPGLRDTLAYFHGFEDGSHGLALEANGSGTWMLAQGALQVRNVGTESLVAVLRSVVLENVTVVTEVTPLASPPQAESRALGVLANVEETADNTAPHGNLLEMTLKEDVAQAVLRAIPGGIRMESLRDPQLFVIGRRYRLILTCGGGLARGCVGRVVALESVTSSPLVTGAPVRPGAIALAAYGADAAFHFLAVYRHGDEP